MKCIEVPERECVRYGPCQCKECEDFMICEDCFLYSCKKYNTPIIDVE